MYAQLTYFDGPRSPELVQAAERGGLERITPTLAADPEVRAAHVATYVLRQPDGGEVVVVIAKSAEALERGRTIITSTELLPGEDPALLRGPDRVEIFEVAHAFDAGFAPLEVTA